MRTTLHDHSLFLPTESPVIQQLPQSIVVDEEVIKNKGVSFDCVVTGAPKLRVSWFKGTENLTFADPSHYRINESSNIRTSIRSTLIIDQPTYEDSGRYTCISTVLNDETDEERFRAQENFTLTVLGENCMLKSTCQSFGIAV